MTKERQLTAAEAASAAQIQRVIDQVAQAGGGRLVLPAMDLMLDRGLELKTGIELVGQGQETVLRKGPGRIYSLAGYHNYGMADVPLKSTAELAVGMTVSIHDDRTYGGFYETFATITWIDGTWIGLDHGIEADYSAEHNPCLTTVYPLVFGHHITRAALRDLRLEGNRAGNDKAMGGCRGGAVYFARSQDIEVTGVNQRDYKGEGLSFQMCRDVRIADCRFDENTGNGLHPGAGSTNALFERCGGAGNERSGFFFCVRANHITVRDCQFIGNRSGISIGTRDCHNLIEKCQIANNRGPGVLVRPTPRPTEVHSCILRHCHITGNCPAEGRGQIEVWNDARDLVFEGNHIDDGARQVPGFWFEGGVRGVFLKENQFVGDGAVVEAEAAASIGASRPQMTSGYGHSTEQAARHLLAV